MGLLDIKVVVFLFVWLCAWAPLDDSWADLARPSLTLSASTWCEVFAAYSIGVWMTIDAT